MMMTRPPRPPPTQGLVAVRARPLPRAHACPLPRGSARQAAGDLPPQQRPARRRRRLHQRPAPRSPLSGCPLPPPPRPAPRSESVGQGGSLLCAASGPGRRGHCAPSQDSVRGQFRQSPSALQLSAVAASPWLGGAPPCTRCSGAGKRRARAASRTAPAWLRQPGRWGAEPGAASADCAAGAARHRTSGCPGCPICNGSRARAKPQSKMEPGAAAGVPPAAPANVPPMQVLLASTSSAWGRPTGGLEHSPTCQGWFGGEPGGGCLFPCTEPRPRQKRARRWSAP